jgi:hypothetical protein
MRHRNSDRIAQSSGEYHTSATAQFRLKTGRTTFPSGWTYLDSPMTTGPLDQPLV